MRHIVAVVGHLQLCQPIDHFLHACAVEGDVVEHTGGGIGSGCHRNAELVRVLCIGFPFGDMDHRSITEVEPVAREAQHCPETDRESDDVSVEVTGGVNVVSHYEIVFEFGQRHGRPPVT